MSTHFNKARRYSPRPPGRRSQSNSWLGRFNELLRWSERSQQRAALRDLADDPHLLRDIGLTRPEALEEAGKPIWR
jgi:uncharacterized protein YjiS (DUF1127 family)